MRKLFYLALVFILDTSKIFAQPTNSEIKDVSMPSPNATSLGVYTDIPVDYATGVPGVSIPIGTVTSGNIQTNVTLSYHAGGIRVGELAGWAGTNWSIQYGGHISRSVQGLKDETTWGYMNIASSIVVSPDTCLSTSYGASGQELAASNGHIDLEPDVFSYSAGGASGKFYIDGNGNVITIPKSDVKITYTLWQNTLNAKRIKSFKITLTDGTMYDYGIDDTGTIDAMELSLYSDGSTWAASGWHLLKITSADGKYSINFNYTQEEYKYYSRAGSTSSPGGININGYNTNKTNMIAYRLASITPSDGTEYISFTANDIREDLEHTVNKESKRLNTIVMRNPTTTLCKEFRFYYSYWSDNSALKSNSVADKRLFLDEVEERSCDGSIVNPRYKFEYIKDNNTTQYINRLSSAVDHWGYYNGAHNNMKGLNIPYTSLTFTWPVNNTTYNDAKGTSNRESNETYMKLGSLKKITFPTGGSKSLEMEANDVFTSDPINVPVPLATLDGAQCTWSYQVPVETYTTSVSGYQYLGDIMYTWENYGSTGQNCCSSPWAKVTLKDAANNFIAEASVYVSCSSTQSNPMIQSGLLSDLFPQIQVNTQYKFELNVFFCGSKFEISDQQLLGINYARKVGGLRAQKVILHDGISTSNDVVKSYKYNNSSGYTSSKLMQPPVYATIYLWKTKVGCGNISTPNVVNFSFFFYEYSKTPLSAFDGKQIFYKDVTEYNENNFGTASGYTKYSYSDESVPLVGFPAVVQPTVNAAELSSATIYNASNSILQSTTNTIQNDSYTDGPNLCVKVLKTSLPSHFNSVIPWRWYRIRNKPYRLSQVTTVMDNISSTKSYTYDATNRFLMATSESVTNSDNKIYSTEYSYIHDYTANYDMRDFLRNRNIINAPFRTVKKVNGVMIDDMDIIYAFYNTATGAFQGSTLANGFGRVSQKYQSEYTFNSGGTPITNGRLLQLTINNYDAYGNIASITLDGWQPITYEWYSNGLMKKTTFQNHIKEYTYYSGTRLLSTFKDIDGQIQSFEFDQLGRLNKISEKGNNIITNVSYHYKEATGDIYNWIKTVKTFTPTANSALTTLENKNILDGLGRSIQDIKVKYSPLQKDIVSVKEYDNKGRLWKEYVPFESAYNNGAFATIPGGTGLTLTTYEPSPLNRVSSVTPPTWYATSTTYGANVANEVLNMATGSYYPANTLSKVTTSNPDNNRLITFKDKMGRDILSWNTNVSYSSHTKTHTLYDDKGRVKTIVPPGATMSTPDLLFSYTYDYSDNILTKKVPGKAIENFLYDNRDLNTFYQDGIMAASNQWVQSEYDVYGRLTASGMIGMPSSTPPNPGSVYSPYSEQYSVTQYYTLLTDGIKLGKAKQQKNKILGTANYIEKNFAYDTYGRPSVVNGTNILYNDPTAENVSYTYDFAGNVITENRTHKQSAVATQNQTVNKRFTYDHSGRAIDHFIALNGATEQKISNLSYTNKDEIKERNLGATLVSSVASYLQSIDYTYNELGWLTKINQESLSANNSALPLTTCTNTIPATQTAYTYAANPDPNDLFYMEMKYDGASFPNISGMPTNIQKSGNIAQIAYRVKGRDKQAYNYAYDYLNRMTAATHYTISSANAATASNLYNENLSYDVRGNINTLNRQGFYTNAGTCTYGSIDALTYTYAANTNKLTAIADAATAASKSRGFNPGLGGTGYTYDVNGNLKTDSYKGITNINYNFLNLPTKIEWGTSKSIEFVYASSGEKLTKTVKTGTATDYVQHYVVGIEYNSIAGTNRRIESIYHMEGRYFNTNTGTTTPTYRTEYTIKDHLGNARVTFTDLNANGKIDATNSANTNEIIQENHYYAFGLNHEGTWLMNNAAKDNAYQYNGKELNLDHGLNWSDYGARWYDAAIGRWSSVDPLASKTPGFSPYNYGNNNPIIMIDPSGNYAISVHYKITYDAFIKAGYSKKDADLYAHYSSTYADHPPGGAMALDGMGNGRTSSPHLIYRNDQIDYSPTAESQDEKNSNWHAMRSDAEAADGMTREQAYQRGLEFGWNSIFESEGKDLGKIGQGVHALQDAIAHRGASTNQHLGKNISSIRMIFNDMYGSQKEAAGLTNTATAVISVLQGKKPNLKDGDKLDARGMSKDQMSTFVNRLVSSGFTGTINFY